MKYIHIINKYINKLNIIKAKIIGEYMIFGPLIDFTVRLHHGID